VATRAIRPKLWHIITNMPFLLIDVHSAQDVSGWLVRAFGTVVAAPGTRASELVRTVVDQGRSRRFEDRALVIWPSVRSTALLGPCSAFVEWSGTVAHTVGWPGGFRHYTAQRRARVVHRVVNNIPFILELPCKSVWQVHQIRGIPPMHRQRPWQRPAYDLGTLSSIFSFQRKKLEFCKEILC